MQIVTATLIASINIKASAAYVTTQQRKLATTTHIDSTLGVSTFWNIRAGSGQRLRGVPLPLRPGEDPSQTFLDGIGVFRCKFLLYHG